MMPAGAVVPRPGRGRFVLVAGAGLAGGVAVALAAVAAHVAGGAMLATAAQFLMVHAALVIAVAAFAGVASLARLWLAAATVLLAGACLFSGDVALHALAGRRLFPMAAPTGGSLVILSWLAVAVLGIIEALRRRP